MRIAMLMLAALGLCLLGLWGTPADAGLADWPSAHARGADSQRANGYFWLEGEGLATRLSPAPLAPEKGLALLAGEMSARTGIALWRLDERGVEALRARLRASLSPARDYSGVTGPGQGLPGKLHTFTLESGARGILTTFSFGSRSYALVLSAPGGAGEDLEVRCDAVIADLWPVAPTAPDQLALLLLEGRYAAVVGGYVRSGARLHKRAGKALLTLRSFALPARDYASRDALQLALEERLRDKGLRRTGGVTLAVAGQEAYCGEYFAAGSIVRILYAELGGDYFVVLLQGPESAREVLRIDAESLAASIKPSGLPPSLDRPRPRPVAGVSRVEVMAWQEGQRLLWGALFDAVWIEPGVKFEVKLTQAGKTLASASGSAQSSLEFNVLGPGGAQSLSLPADARGEALLELKLAGLSASLRVTLK